MDDTDKVKLLSEYLKVLTYVEKDDGKTIQPFNKSLNNDYYDWKVLSDQKVVNNSHGRPEIVISLDHSTIQGNTDSYYRTETIKSLFHVRIDQRKII